MPFQIEALDAEPFQPLFDLTDAELSARQMRRVTVDAQPGFPCRVSLCDAEIGKTMILLNYAHQDAPTPYHSKHAIYVSEGAQRAHPRANTVPPVLRIRPISLRGFDQGGNMIAADLAEGDEVADAIDALFETPEVAYIRLHNAKPGCYAARAVRV